MGRMDQPPRYARRRRTPICVFAPLLTLLAAGLTGAEPAVPEPPEPPPISAGEPLAHGLSLQNAARSLDQSSFHWQATHECGTCHTNFAYLVARPALSAVSPPLKGVRSFFEEMVETRWEKEGPRWDAEVVTAAVCLALNDRLTTGMLHPLTRKALDRMCSLQRADGGWTWLKCGWPPMESDDHYGATFAALGIALSPGEYSRSEKGERCLVGIRRFLRDNPPPSLHHRAMLLWASLHVDGLLGDAEKERVKDELWGFQLPDGGWATAGLLADFKAHRRQDQEPQVTKKSDGYGTGFVVYLLRQAGIPAQDPRLKRAVAWLKTNQRESGRWFTPSPTMNSQHYISNVGTAFAVMALAACGEVRVARF